MQSVPTCCNYGCDSMVSMSSRNRYRPHCSYCHKAGYKGKKLRPGVTSFKIGKCSNQDSHLGFSCATDYHNAIWAIGKTQIDHIDGNHLNNDVSNLQELCPSCHQHKGTLNKDFSRGKYDYKTQPQPNLKENTMIDANSAITLAENMIASLGATNREVVRLVLDQLVLTVKATSAQSSPSTKKDAKLNGSVQELVIGNNKIRRKDTDPYYEVYTKQINKNVPLRLVFSDGTESNILSPNVLAPFIRKNGILAIPCHRDGKIKMGNTDRYRTLFQ